MSLRQDENRHSLQNTQNSYELRAAGEHPVPERLQPPSMSLIRRMLASFDEEKGDNDVDGQPIEIMKRDLKGYHIQMIALGSAIGTGLFIASGEALAIAGPIPLLFAFIFVGAALCPTIFALGEIATLDPDTGGFFEHCRKYTDEAWGGAMGWNYVLQWLVALPLELVAASMTVEYWGEPLKARAAWVALFLAGLSMVNVLGVKRWGDVEAGLSLMKVAAILGFIIFGVLCDLGLGFKGNAIGAHTWYDPGAAINGGLGFCSVLVTAAFAYSGSEMVGLTASEQENPKRDMPRAIKQVFFRISVFYIVSIYLVGLLVPYNDPGLIKDSGSLTSKASPFVIAINNAGVMSLPTLFNIIILVTILSVANASVYGSSRVLNAMANQDLAPKCFAYVDKKGRPLRCFYLSLAFGFLAFLTEVKDQGTVFTWLLSICGLSSIITWTSICWTHIQFRKALKLHSKALSTLPYESPLGVFGSWVGLLLNAFIIIAQFVTAIVPVGYHTMSAGQRAQHVFQNIMAFPLVLIVFVLFKKYKGTKIEDGKLVWGPGTKRVDLVRDVNFDDAWNEGDYVKWAFQHPEEIIKRERLWWCWKPMRKYITFFDFPWRLPIENKLVKLDGEDKIKWARIRHEEEERRLELRNRETFQREQELQKQAEMVALRRQKMEQWTLESQEVHYRDQ